MSQEQKLTDVKLCVNGRVVSSPELISKFKGTKILSIDLENKRLSGGTDTFNVHFANTLGVVVEEGMYIEVTGDIRTMNAKDTDHVIYQFIMAKSVKILPGEPEEYKNDVEINGAKLISFDGVRSSYSDESKVLATYRIGVTRRHGRNSYFRVTTWGRDSVFIGNIYKSVKYLHLRCRLQSFHSKSSGRLRFCLVSYYLEVPEADKLAAKEGLESDEGQGQSEVEALEEAALAESAEIAADEEEVPSENSAETVEETTEGETV